MSNAPDDALKAAVRYLSHRPRSEAEIKEHLRCKGYSTTLAAQTLDKLRSLHYADDETFARDWVRSRAENRGYGPRRIDRELSAKGVDEFLIRDALAEIFGRENEREKARLALAKQFRGEKFDEPKVMRRAAAFLQRRGFSEAVIFSLLRHDED